MSRGANKCQNAMVSLVSLILSGKEFKAADATFTKFSASATFDVVSGVGRPHTRSTTGFSD